MWVFPGGRVEPSDGPVDSLVAARRAAVRELAEETRLTVEAAALVPLARWTTPAERRRRYRAWFFLAHDSDGDAVVDDAEIVAARWVTPAEALARTTGDWKLPPPVFVTLTRLAALPGPDERLAEARRGPILFDPRNAIAEGGAVSLYQGDAGYAQLAPDAPGSRHRLWTGGERWTYEVDPRREGPFPFAARRDCVLRSEGMSEEDAKGGAERRVHERFAARIAVDVHSDGPSGDHFLFAYIENISEMGIFVPTHEPLPPGTELTLRFTAAEERVELDGSVMWINPVRDDGDNPNPGMGIRFSSLTPDDRERIVELVRAVAYLNADD